MSTLCELNSLNPHKNPTKISITISALLEIRKLGNNVEVKELACRHVCGTPSCLSIEAGGSSLLWAAAFPEQRGPELYKKSKSA